MEPIRKHGTRGTWEAEQKLIMKQYFNEHIRKKITPKKQECLVFQNENRDMFVNKSWLQIKVFVYNMFKNRNKN